MTSSTLLWLGRAYQLNQKSDDEDFIFFETEIPMKYFNSVA